MAKRPTLFNAELVFAKILKMNLQDRFALIKLNNRFDKERY